jgi:hypothetical protein
MPQGAQRSWGGWIGSRMSPNFRKSVLSFGSCGRLGRGSSRRILNDFVADDTYGLSRGVLGGMVNAILSDNGFVFPKKEGGILRPGFLGNTS